MKNITTQKAEQNEKFLWLSPFAPLKGYKSVPPGGMCLCAFLFVIRGREVLLGKYREHPAWKKIAGMDEGRIKNNSHGFTLPASHLKFGEEPLVAARRVGEEILQLPIGLTYSEPLVQTFFYEPMGAPGELHYDLLLLHEVIIDADLKIDIPPWYTALEWFDVDVLMNQKYARQHEDVILAWMTKKRTRF